MFTEIIFVPFRAAPPTVGASCTRNAHTTAAAALLLSTTVLTMYVQYVCMYVLYVLMNNTRVWSYDAGYLTFNCHRNPSVLHGRELAHGHRRRELEARHFRLYILWRDDEGTCCCAMMSQSRGEGLVGKVLATIEDQLLPCKMLTL